MTHSQGNCQSSTGYRGKAKHAGQRGVALLLVLVTMAFMSVIAVEIGFASRVDLRIGQNARNRLQAYYMAMSAAKLSLLRLHMYYQVKNQAASNANLPIPKDLIDRIWSIPLPPFPLDPSKSKWPGSMSASIQSEGSKIPINLLDAHNYRHSSPEKQLEVVNQIKSLFTSLFEDEEFDKAYRGLDVQELINNLVDWIDPNEEKVGGGDEAGDYDQTDPRYYPRNDRIPTLSEIHMIKGWSDDLYNKVVGNFSVLNLETTVNANYITPQRLKAIDSKLSQEDLTAIVRRRQTQPFANLKDLEAYITTSPDIKNGRDFKLPADLKDNVAETIFLIEASGQVGDKAIRKIRLGVKIPQKTQAKAGAQQGEQGQEQQAQGEQAQGEQAQGGSSNPADQKVELLPPVVVTIGESL